MSQQARNTSGVSHLRIERDRAGQRLDNFLMSQLKGVPRARIYRIIRSGEVRVNKKRARQTYRLVAGDTVRVPPVRTAESGPAPVSRELGERIERALLYSDDHLLIYNKPAGLAVHGGSGIQVGLIETLRSLYPDENGLELAHRLDRDTSGCIMVTRDRHFLRNLQRLMRGDGITKRYWLLCHDFPGKEKTVEAPLEKGGRGGERIMHVADSGKAARTHFRRLERLGGLALVEATLDTGRTHQIRVHAQHGGFPLVGDPKYGDAEKDAPLREAGVRRLCLHARSLRFRHPETGETLEVEAPLDEAMEAALTTARELERA
jgi:23S rRNA pseudouridine955/2504/2580 synthase